MPASLRRILRTLAYLGLVYAGACVVWWVFLTAGILLLVAFPLPDRAQVEVRRGAESGNHSDRP